MVSEKKKTNIGVCDVKVNNKGNMWQNVCQISSLLPSDLRLSLSKYLLGMVR